MPSSLNPGATCTCTGSYTARRPTCDSTDTARVTATGHCSQTPVDQSDSATCNIPLRTGYRRDEELRLSDATVEITGTGDQHRRHQADGSAAIRRSGDDGCDPVHDQWRPVTALDLGNLATTSRTTQFPAVGQRRRELRTTTR